MQNSGGKAVIYQLMVRLFGNKQTSNVKYGTIAENGVGKFDDINPAALKAIKELGATHVWYTGVIEHAQLSDYTDFGIPLDDADVVKGRAGSPYAIKDYYDVDPDLATSVPNRMNEFEALIGRTHNEGLRVIIDFVPNHVARRYHSDAKPGGVKDFGENDDVNVEFSPSNNFYYLPGQTFSPPAGYNPLGADTFKTKDSQFEENPAKVTANNKFTPSPAIDDWFDAVKLNYGVDYKSNTKHFDPIPDTWLKMRDILLYWVSKDVDGFRCDMAEMVPVEFWSWVIPQAKQAKPDLTFIAEVYNPAEYRDYLKGGFDFLYDKVQLYDTLRNVMKASGGTPAIARVQESLSDINQKMLHFMENHDEQRIASSFAADDPWKTIPAVTISATIDRGPFMIYFGQEVGEPANGSEGFGSDDGRTTIYDYWGIPNHQRWMNNGKFDGGGLSPLESQLRQYYSTLMQIITSNPAIAEGEYVDLSISNQELQNFSDKVHAFARIFGDQRLVVVSNFGDKMEKITVHLPDEVVKKMNLDAERKYIGRDLMPSGLDIGLDDNFSFGMDAYPYASYIIKIK